MKAKLHDQSLFCFRVYNILVLSLQCNYLKQQSSLPLDQYKSYLFLLLMRESTNHTLYFNQTLEIIWNVSGTPNLKNESLFSAVLCTWMDFRTDPRSTALTQELETQLSGTCCSLAQRIQVKGGNKAGTWLSYVSKSNCSHLYSSVWQRTMIFFLINKTSVAYT